MQPNAKRLPSGRWRARAYDYTDANGKRHYVSFTANSKSEAQAAARAHKPSLCRDKPSYLNLSLKQAYKRYVDSHTNTLSPSTVREYTRARTRDFPALMDLRLKDITPELVQTAVNEASKKYAPKTVRDKHGLLHKVLKLYAPHIILNTDLPRSEVTEVYVPITEEVRSALNSANDILRVPIMLASQGSLRRSEICALTPADITDFGVSITKAKVKDENNKWVIKPPKTEAGTRFCRLPADVIKEARNYDFSSLTPDKLERHWQKLKEKQGFQFKFHAFRHYWASLLHEKGFPDKYIAKMGGWKTTEMLHRIYAHALRDKLPEYTNKVVDIFSTEFTVNNSNQKQA